MLQARKRRVLFILYPANLILTFVSLLLIAMPAMAEIITFTYSIEKPTLHYLSDGTVTVNLPNAIQDESIIGAPLLPMLASRLYVPDGQSVDKVDVAYGPMVELPGTYVVAHATSPVPIGTESAPKPESPSPAIYGSSNAYPPQTWSRRSDQVLHGYRIVLTNIFPVRYFPALSKLEYATTVTVTITTSPAKAAASDLSAPRNAADDIKSVQKIIDNSAALSSMAKQANASPLDTSRQYLIITTNVLQSAFQALQNHRASSAGGGFTCALTTVENIASSQSGQDLTEKIRNYINVSYTQHGTQYVVLGGDADGAQANQTLPTRGCPATVGSYSDTYIPTDFYYACLDGTWDNNGNGIFGETTDGVGGGDIDWLPEVAVGRIPADSVQEAQNAINKIIAFETSGSNPAKALLVGEKLDTTPTWAGDRMDYVYAAMNSMEHETLYDRDAGGTNWSFYTLVSLLSSNNYNVIFHLGHSNVTYNMRLSNSDLDTIKNDKFFLVYSQGCYSNSFDNRFSDGSYGNTDSMGEDFVVRNANNAFAYIGNSRYGWYNPGSYVSGASNLVHRKFAEAVFQSHINRLGPANNASKLNLDFTNGLYRWLGFELNLMGDPATLLNTTCQGTQIAISLVTPAPGFEVRSNNSTQVSAQVQTGCGDVLTGATVSVAFSNNDTLLTLYDDGAHGDGAANDGVYGATWTPRHSGAVTLTATATKNGYAQGQATTSGTVMASGLNMGALSLLLGN